MPQFRVLQVIPELDAGGAERSAVDVARAVVASGGKSWIATEGGRLASEAEASGATIVKGSFASKNPLTIWKNAGVLADFVRKENISIVHARSRAPAWSAFYAAQRTGIAYVATYHGVYNAKGSLKRYYNGIMARGDAVIANSQYTADHVLAEHQVDPAHLYVIPRGIDVAGFTPDNVSPARIDAIRSAWGLTPGKPVIVLPNRLTRWKGQLVLVEALAKLRGDFQAVMVGDAQERDGFVEELKTAIASAKLTDIVRIPGHCSDMPAALLLADVVVAPSIEPEAFGRAAVEAQAMQRPLVATRLGAQSETVVDGVTGFLVPPNDAAALAHAIAQALAMTPEQRAAMGRAGRERVLRLYTVESMCVATLDVYRKVLAGHALA